MKKKGGKTWRIERGIFVCSFSGRTLIFNHYWLHMQYFDKT